MSTAGAGHEPSSQDEVVVGPSNRSFGLVFMVVFAIVALAPLWSGGQPRGWALVVSGSFGAAAIAAPALLTPLNRLWLRLGLLMHRVVNPVVMGAIFYLVVTPFGLVMRLLGKGLAQRLRPDPRASSYWIDRTGQPPSRMDQQF